ncbi:MAG: DUF1329 domain-containing protein [Rugosibacter sp.]|nr:DUF1329 domain-containing protein [Rugosibacter sp.]MDO9272969.1 DUF1329 domain-containing protein [Rugosibacter sp.]
MNIKANTRTLKIVAACAAAFLAQAAHAVTDAELEEAFFPYKKGFPTAPGLKAGMVINKSNVDQFKDIIIPGHFKLIKDGWMEIPVAATFDMPLPKPYIEATKQHADKVKLGTTIEGFVSGRPFPQQPSASDPRAGEKLAWNFKYGLNWGDGAIIYPFYWRYINANTGAIERTMKFEFHFLNFMHRIVNDPKPNITPNPSQLYRGTYVKVHEPLDLKNTQLLIQAYEDDLKRSDAYLYLGFQRRVRRLATGQTTDSFLGSDLMIEDFEGYNGRVSDYKWKFIETKNALMPYYKHNEMKKFHPDFKEADGYKFIGFTGKANCTPDITWQLRKVHVLEGRPVDAGHPISKRLIYLDAQIMTPSMSTIYDRKGEIWKSFQIGKAHPDFHLSINKDSGIPLDDSGSVIDLQSNHCTAITFRGEIDPAKNPATIFQVQNLRGGD